MNNKDLSHRTCLIAGADKVYPESQTQHVPIMAHKVSKGPTQKATARNKGMAFGSFSFELEQSQEENA